ncbi:MAG: ATP-dependent helicase [Bifidobacteriaceae bacterium]|jgi:DNA helicase-2/ATP-dependent DNA helicase PcrA|nr:ATP-dependent helicase [Bifidobacteriaceae bacterium]
MSKPQWTPQDLAKHLGEHQPTAEQAAVIDAPLAPTLVAAGAGSGKTQTMAFRVAYLVANGLVEGGTVLGLTFTRKAAGELAARIRSMLGRLDLPDTGQPAVATYNSYAVGIVRDHALRLGYDPEAEVLSEGTRWQLAMEVVEGWEAQPLPGVAPATLAGLVLTLSDQCVDNGIDPAVADLSLAAIIEDLSNKGPGTNPATGKEKRAVPPDIKKAIESLTKRQAVMDLVRRYADLKRQRGQMDFADQVALAARLVGEFPVIGQVERERYRVVLLDEYQDTSGSQVELLSTLFGGHPVMAVGDPHQSIYGWRGAQAATLARFGEAFGAAGQPLTLSTAWRNDQSILDVANRVAQPLRAVSAIDLPLLQARPGAGPGLVEAGFHATDQAEATAVAEYLQREWHDAPPVGSRHRTAAVLCRTQGQFGLIAQALLQAGLPHQLVGMGGLLSIPEVQDVVALLRCAQDPSRGDAFMRLATAPRYNLGARDLDALGRLAKRLAPDIKDTKDTKDTKGITVPEAVMTPGVLEALAAVASGQAKVTGLSEAGTQRLQRLARAIAQVRDLSARLAPPELVQAAERALGLDIDLMARYGPAGRTHLHQLVLEAHGFQRQMTGAGGLAGFLDWLQHEQDRGRGLEPGLVAVSEEAIQVMTVHAAKGLEWDVVVVPGLVAEKFPSTHTDKEGRFYARGWLSDSPRSGGTGGLPWELRRDVRDLPRFAHAAAADVVQLDEAYQDYLQEAGRHALAEERRVAYVALTRARSRLYLSGSWRVEGRKTVQQPSIFLEELLRAGLVSDATWAPQPEVIEDQPRGDWADAREDGEEGALTTAGDSAAWPLDHPLGDRAQAVLAAADQVKHQLGQLPPLRGVSQAIAYLDGLGDPLAAQAADLLRERQEAAQTATVRLPPSLGATGLAALLADPNAAALGWRRPVPAAPTVATQVGLLFHQRAEAHLRAVHGSVGEQPTLEGADDWGLPPQDEAEVVAQVDRLMAAFIASRWVGTGLDLVDAEAAMVFQVGGVTAVARADAVFYDRAAGQYMVVDWKTGQAAADGSARPQHAAQVRLYQVALAQRLGLEPGQVLGYVHYVPQNLSVEVTAARAGGQGYLAELAARLEELTGQAG